MRRKAENLEIPAQRRAKLRALIAKQVSKWIERGIDMSELADILEWASQDLRAHPPRVPR
jgi:hypothetical protein